jgi:hypothetical protein
MFENLNYFLKITEICAHEEGDWNNSQINLIVQDKNDLLRQKTPVDIYLNDLRYLLHASPTTQVFKRQF